MKQTSDKLELVEMFAFWTQLFVGGNFLLIGLFAGFYTGNFLLYFFAVVGLFLVIFIEIETITFDKNLGNVTIKRHKPLIAKTKVIKHLLQDISGVEIQETSSSKSNTYRVCLVLDSGKHRVPLTSNFSTGLGSKHKKAEVIATFLNIRNYGLDGFPTETLTNLNGRR